LQGNNDNPCLYIKSKVLWQAAVMKSQAAPKLNQGNEIDDKINYQNLINYETNSYLSHSSHSSCS
jgi:hypothetical protein